MFKLIRHEEIKSLEIEYFEFEHTKTKAKHIHLKADDKENAFVCGVKTVSDNSTGVAHILEHSCLMGSKDFNIKDPFSGLMKKSLNTFLNAMTGPLSTSYPHASKNKKDFFNIMNVTINAVFFPNLKKEVFLQEGWRFEFAEPTNPESDLTYKGVVYNEMKGIMSSPNHKLVMDIFNELYPQSFMAENFGGEPNEIPTLSYEEFKAFHKKYYHPSNAVFLTYGDIPYTEIQEKIEDFVLQHFDYSDVEFKIKEFVPFKKPKTVDLEYPINEEPTDRNNYYIKVWHICDFSDFKTSLSFYLLNQIIGADDSCIMKAALKESGLIANPTCYFSSDNKNNYLVIGGDGVSKDNVKALDELIQATICNLYTNNINLDTIKKELHQFELGIKTKSTGGMTYGLNLLFSILELALLDMDCIKYLNIDTIIEDIKKYASQPDYLQSLIKDKIIDNPHRIDMFYKGSKELFIEELSKEKQKLADIKAKLTNEEASKIVKNYQDLEIYQNQVNDTSILPNFGFKDIPKETNLEELKSQEYHGKTVYAFNAPTIGLTYMSKRSFLKDVKISDLPYISLYFSLFGSLGYGDFDYKQAQEKQYSICQNISAVGSLGSNIETPDDIYMTISFSSKMLHENAKEVKEFFDNFINNLRFDESEHIKRIIKQMAINIKKTYYSSGHSHALNLAAIDFSKASLIKSYYSGINLLRFIINLADSIEDESSYNEFIVKLKEVHKKVKYSYNNSALFVADLKENLQKDIEIFEDDTIVSKPERSYIKQDITSDGTKAVLSSSDVNYCAMIVPTKVLANHELSGAAYVLSKIMDSDYTHIEIREKGGAYGGGTLYDKSTGVIGMYSFHDPHISQTFKTFENARSWLENPDNITSAKIEEGILSTIAALDHTGLKVQECMAAFNRHIQDISDNEFKKFRENVLNTNVEQVRKLINEYIIPNLEKKQLAVVANKHQFEKEQINLSAIEM